MNTTAYGFGAQNWIDGQNLYADGIRFIYLPQSAVLYAPFHLLPEPVEQVVWRAVTIGLFALGVFRLTRLARPDSWYEFFPLVTVLVLPKTWTTAYNGQATPAMAGVLMLALTAVHERRWNRSAFLLLASLAFKPLAIVLLLLLWVLYRPLWWRLPVGLVVFFAVPYLTQDWRYVNSQYAAVMSMFDDAMRVGMTTDWAQIFSLGSLAGVTIPQSWQTIVRIAMAGATLALCWGLRRKMHDEVVVAAGGARHDSDFRSELRTKIKSLTIEPRGQIKSAAPGLILIHALSVCYLLLMNPRTENNSYMMLTPVLAVYFMQAAFVDRRMVRAGLLCAGVVALTAGHAVCDILTPTAGFVWICPLVCLVFALDCVVQALRMAARAAAAPAHGVAPPVTLPFSNAAPSAAAGMADAA